MAEGNRTAKARRQGTVLEHSPACKVTPEASIAGGVVKMHAVFSAAN